MQMLLIRTGQEDKGKTNGKKDKNKNRHSFDVQSLGQFQNLDQMPRFEYPLSPSHPAVTYHWRCQSSSLTEYTTFFFLLLFSVDGIYRRVAL